MQSRAMLDYCLTAPEPRSLSRDVGAALHHPVGYYLPAQCCPSPGPSPSPSQITAQLENKELWEKFNSVGTEMILTKNGRRMFPELSVSLSGLDPYGLYALCVQAVPEGDTRYKWRDGGWTKSGKAEAGPPTRLYMHPESPALGHRWMDRPVCFSKIRLTNNTLSQGGQIVLQSMHRYSLRLYIIPAAGHGTHSCVSFPETAFIAVTSYQNSRLSLLKIEENPFAKGIKYFKNQLENCKAVSRRFVSTDTEALEKCRDLVTYKESLESLDCSHSPRKRINRSEQSEDTSPGCKKFKEGAEDEHSVTEETEEEGEGELCVTDESPEREKKRRTVIDESPAPREDRHSAKSADKLGRREETPRGLVLAMPKAVDHCGPTSQRQAWLSPPPPAVPQLPIPSYSQSPCLIGHRFDIQYQSNVTRFPTLVPPMPSICPATPPPFFISPWASPPVRVSGLHPPLFQQLCPPTLYLDPHTICRGL